VLCLGQLFLSPGDERKNNYSRGYYDSRSNRSSSAKSNQASHRGEDWTGGRLDGLRTWPARACRGLVLVAAAPTASSITPARRRRSCRVRIHEAGTACRRGDCGGRRKDGNLSGHRWAHIGHSGPTPPAEIDGRHLRLPVAYGDIVEPPEL